MRYYFAPSHLFMASGTWSDPEFNPIPDVPLINAGAPNIGPYDGRAHYGKAAFTGAFSYALNNPEWDLLVCMDTDALFLDVDLDTLLKDFMKRKETMLAPGWLGHPGGPMVVWKREGAGRALHFRQTANLRDKDEDIPMMVWEVELAHIFRGGQWWNPWPELWTCMNDGTPERMKWPMISKVPSEEVDEFIEKAAIHTKPVRP